MKSMISLFSSSVTSVVDAARIRVLRSRVGLTNVIFFVNSYNNQ